MRDEGDSVEPRTGHARALSGATFGDEDEDAPKSAEYWEKNFAGHGGGMSRYFNSKQHPLKQSARCAPRLPHPNLFPQQWRDELVQESDVVAQEVNHHVCTFSCYKNGRKTCRNAAPWQTQQETTLHPETGIIRVQRNDPFLNTYNRACMFVCRCNMDIKYVLNTTVGILFIDT